MKGFLVDFYNSNGEKMASKRYDVGGPKDAAMAAEEELKNNFCIYCDPSSEIGHSIGVISSKVAVFHVSRINR